MTQGQKEIISIRTISCAFTVLALAIFKPFGFEVWQWEHCAHLLAIFAMGVVSCMVTESLLEYLVRMPRSTERGVNYIIRRNLWFQCINTPLVALMICLYRHCALPPCLSGQSQTGGANRLQGWHHAVAHPKLPHLHPRVAQPPHIRQGLSQNPLTPIAGCSFPHKRALKKVSFP